MEDSPGLGKFMSSFISCTVKLAIKLKLALVTNIGTRGRPNYPPPPKAYWKDGKSKESFCGSLESRLTFFR